MIITSGSAAPRRQAPAATEPNNTQTQRQVEKPSGERAVSLSRLRLALFLSASVFFFLSIAFCELLFCVNSFRLVVLLSVYLLFERFSQMLIFIFHLFTYNNCLCLLAMLFLNNSTFFSFIHFDRRLLGFSCLYSGRLFK